MAKGKKTSKKKGAVARRGSVGMTRALLAGAIVAGTGLGMWGATTWWQKRIDANQPTTLAFGSETNPTTVSPLFFVGGGLLAAAALVKRAPLWARGIMAGSGAALVLAPMTLRMASTKLGIQLPAPLAA